MGDDEFGYSERQRDLYHRLNVAVQLCELGMHEIAARVAAASATRWDHPRPSEPIDGTFRIANIDFHDEDEEAETDG